MEKETLEEAAQRIFDGFGDITKPSAIKRALELVKWQQEQDKNKYSEKEVMDMFDKFSMHLPLHYEFLVKEQFKNK
jgi:hypothetical protein